MRIVPVLLLLVSSVVVSAAGSVLEADAGWIREAPPSAPVRAGYLVVRNGSETDQAITGASSDAFGAIEIHEMVDTGDGVMRMRRVQRLDIPAGEAVELKPGGLHLMLFRPARSLARGERVPLTLETADGQRVRASLEQR